MRASSSSSSLITRQLRLTEHLTTRQISTLPNADPVLASGVASIAGAGTDPAETFRLRSLVKWVSGIVVGSSIGYASWTYADEIYSPVKKAVSSLVEWSTGAGADDAAKNPKFMLRDAFRRKVFFNYEKRMRLRSPPEKAEKRFDCSFFPLGIKFSKRWISERGEKSWRSVFCALRVFHAF